MWKAARITSLREKRDHLRQQLASLNEEHALVVSELASLQGFPSVEEADAPIMEERVACKHFCAHHTALIDPAVWRNLPEEVLQMVFARLPLRQIVSLQCLSKAWHWNVAAKESGFRRLCARAGSSKPKMFALADESKAGMGIVSIKLFDGEAQKWHVYDITLEPQFYGTTMLACDGGLVCFVSRMLNIPFIIVVLNPLTKEYKVLPKTTYRLYKYQPHMVRLLLDRETKCYKVIVVGRKNRAGVCNSATGRWSGLDSMSDVVFGYCFRWTADENGPMLVADEADPCSYIVCREPEVGWRLADHVNLSPESCRAYCLLNDRLYELHLNETYQRSMLRPEVDEKFIITRFILSEWILSHSPS